VLGELHFYLTTGNIITNSHKGHLFPTSLGTDSHCETTDEQNVRPPPHTPCATEHAPHGTERTAGRARSLELLHANRRAER
jgi:hypothetical protein